MARKYGLIAMTALISAALLAFSFDAQAQGPQGGRGRGGMGGMGGMGMGGPGMGPGGGAMSLMMLLNNDKIQKELELVDDQKSKITEAEQEMRNAMRDSFGSLQDLSGEERMAKMQELMKKSQEDVNKKLGEILLPNQLKRLKEIQLQMEGATALFNADVVKELNITTEQQEKMKTVREEANSKTRDIMSGMRDLSREERQQKMTELRDQMTKARDDVNKKLMEVLTQEQRDQFEKMKGAKVDIDFSTLMGPGGRQGGRGGRQGGPGGPPPGGEN